MVANVPIVGGKTNVVSVVLGDEMVFGVDLEEYCNYDYRDNLDYLTFYCDEAGTIGWKSYSLTTTIQYSKDFGATWTNITSTSSGATISVSAGDIVWFKGNNSYYCSSYGYYSYFTLSNKAHVYGNVNSLTGNNNSVSEYCFRYLFYSCSNLYTYKDKRITLPATSLSNYCYSNMFRGCTNMTDPPILPATSMADYCYEYMFCNCTGLKSCPELPATSLVEGCYQYMFANCSSLVAAPELPATTLASTCYGWMFTYCSSLVKAPELPATTLKSTCYKSMFAHCSNLVLACELPATSVTQYCYSYMFYDCPKLLVAPKVLPADNLPYECYRQMFEGCSSLKTAPEILATTMSEQNCCMRMFYGCSSLNYIKALFLTTPSDVYTQTWVGSVAKTGTFVKNKNATWDVTGSNGVPTGWTVSLFIPPVGKFTINANGDQVGSAPGNLVITKASPVSNSVARFFEHQWDVSSVSTVNVGDDVDQFAWVGASGSMSGYYGMVDFTYSMYSSSSHNSFFGSVASESLADDYGAIPSLISSYGEGWRILSISEWSYLCQSRLKGGSCNGVANPRYTMAKINSDTSPVYGAIIFPDGFSLETPTGVSWGDINRASAYTTICTSDGWSALEAAGCVFLPQVGSQSTSSYTVYLSSTSGQNTGYSSYFTGAKSFGFGYDNSYSYSQTKSLNNARCYRYPIRMFRDY